MIKVTPRAIAYACVQASTAYCYLYNFVLIQLFQLHFALSDAPFWTEEHAGIDYQDLYNFIIDYLEVPEGQEAKAHVKKLLTWWNKQAYIICVLISEPY